MTQSRNIKDGPFCWQNKAARRKIREAFDRNNTVTTALAVYDALTEIASDEQAETFTTTQAWISQRSGVSPRTVGDRLRELAEIGLLAITTPKLRAPSEFTLLTVPQPVPNDKQALPNVRQRAKKRPLPAYKESPEQSSEQSPKERTF